jgi:hypothetical protein
MTFLEAMPLSAVTMPHLSLCECVQSRSEV